LLLLFCRNKPHNLKTIKDTSFAPLLAATSMVISVLTQNIIQEVTSPRQQSGVSAMTVDDSDIWTGRVPPTATKDHQEPNTLTSPFLMMPSTASNNINLLSNPFDQLSADARDPDINSTVQDHAREPSTLLNRMPRNVLTPMIAGLQLDPTPALTVQTFDLLGLGNAWASPIPTAPESVQPDNLSSRFHHHRSAPLFVSHRVPILVSNHLLPFHQLHL
jgi:hypothetical protein